MSAFAASRPVAQLRSALPARLGRAAAALFIAYSIVTLLGIGLTVAFAALLDLPAPPPGATMLAIPAYAATLPFHPLLNLLVWPLLAAWYFRPASAAPAQAAARLGAFWTLITLVVDVFGWVIIRHPWSLTFREFYVDYQPWITLVYLAIFVSPLLAAWWRRVRAAA
jgi:hypothetical protein